MAEVRRQEEPLSQTADALGREVQIARAIGHAAGARFEGDGGVCLPTSVIAHDVESLSLHFVSCPGFWFEDDALVSSVLHDTHLGDAGIVEVDAEVAEGAVGRSHECYRQH